MISLIGVVARERRIEAQLPWKNDTTSSFDDGQVLNTVSVVIIYLETPLEEDHHLVTPHYSSSVVGEACSKISLEIIS